MCLNPRIIVNPRFIKLHKLGIVSRITMGDRTLLYQPSAEGDFPFKYFHPKRNFVTTENIDNFYYSDSDGVATPLYIVTNCGKCEACIALKRNSIKSRMILEQSFHKCPPLFLTLTYNDDNLPPDGVSVRDVQLFLKRLRRYLEYHFPNMPLFRYMAFSEYAPDRTRRAHYHLIIFGLDIINPYDALKLESIITNCCWKKGFAYCRVCDSGCFNYVSKYVCKKSNVPKGKNPNFSLASRRNGGIGSLAFRDSVNLSAILLSDDARITVLSCGKYFTVTVPKSLRNYVLRDASSLYSPKDIQTLKTMFNCFHKLSLLCTCGVTNKSLSDNGLTSDIIKLVRKCEYPSNIIDKFRPLNRFPSSYSANDYNFYKHLFSSDIPFIATELKKSLNYLNNLKIDLQKAYFLNYLCERLKDLWTSKIVEYAENHSQDNFSLLRSYYDSLDSNGSLHPC